MQKYLLGKHNVKSDIKSRDGFFLVKYPSITIIEIVWICHIEIEQAIWIPGTVFLSHLWNYKLSEYQQQLLENTNYFLRDWLS